MQGALPGGWAVTLELLKAAGGFIAVGGFLMALYTFRQSVRTKRAEWLASLHKDFFESGRYVNVRRILDYKPEPEYSELRSAVVNGTYSAATDELHRYLNFFEFLAGLRKLNQISDDEIIGLFDYDLSLIREHDYIAQSLESQGYERLNALIASTRTRLVK